MKLLRWTPLLLTIGVAMAPSRALASSSRHHRLGVDLGLGSAVGVAGLSYAFAPIDWLRFEAGIGVGITGPQFSFMPKVSVGESANRFVAGVGISGSSYRDVHGRRWDIAWLNVDAVGYERRFESGLSLGVGGGITMNLSRFHWDVGDIGQTSPPGTLFPQFRFGLGYWF